MTRQHFVELAKEIARIPSGQARQEAAYAVARAAQKFNPRFDRVRFLEACGVGE